MIIDLFNPTSASRIESSVSEVLQSFRHSFAPFLLLMCHDGREDQHAQMSIVVVVNMIIVGFVRFEVGRNDARKKIKL